MSGSIQVGGNYAGYGLLGTIVADSEAAKQHVDTLTQQVGSGLVSSTYAGLGAQASVALSLAPAVAHYQNWQTNIGVATSQISLTLNALSQISDIASTFYADTNNLNGLNASEVDDIAQNARAALAQVAGLLDSTDGSGNYVFSGQDSGNPPVPDPDAIWSSGFATQIQGAVANLAGTGAAGVIASTLATASSNAAGTSPFSTALSQPAATVNALQTTVQTGNDGQRATTGILASANGFIASGGSSTTGSYVRDILRGLATLGSLSSSQIGTTGFGTVVGDVQASLGGAISALNEDAGVLGNTSAQLTTTQTQLQSTSNALTAQLGTVQDVDMTQALSSLTAAQTQLQASYQLINNIQSLSLVKYLPTS